MKVYCTKWAVARGILHVEASKPFRINRSRFEFVHIKVQGWRADYPLRLGQEVFLSLKDAEDDARERFEKQYRKAEREMAKAKQVKRLILQGKGPVVHRAPTTLAQCHAFPSSVSSYLG